MAFKILSRLFFNIFPINFRIRFCFSFIYFYYFIIIIHISGYDYMNIPKSRNLLNAEQIKQILFVYCQLRLNQWMFEYGILKLKFHSKLQSWTNSELFIINFTEMQTKKTNGNEYLLWHFLVNSEIILIGLMHTYSISLDTSVTDARCWNSYIIFESEKIKFFKNIILAKYLCYCCENVWRIK